ncbi:MAG: hypothetical protein K2M91_02155 [Lachnospiraceae bacterium]|nr:hypothetical protein [Lachnospiraceae bacterium]
MHKLYNGYKIEIAWCDKTLGFQFAIYDKDSKKVSGSIDPYSFEEYALIEAKREVDMLNKNGGGSK